MDDSSPSLREQGIQALREGKVDAAVDLLARAVMADGQDAEAQAFLGVAYSQKGLSAQAIRALQTAVELQPGNASFEFNLGVALEHAGETARAAAAYQSALQINPEHAQARARLQSLGSSTAASPAQPAPPAGAAPAPGAPWLTGQSLTAPLAGPPGTVQCPQCKQWSKPGLSCEWCSASLKSGPAPVSGPVTPGMGGATSYSPERPFGISVLVVLSCIGGVLGLIGSALMLVGLSVGLGAAGMAARPGAMAAGAVVMGLTAFLLLYSLAILITAAFLWRGQNWARIVFIVLEVIGIISAALQLLQGKNLVLSGLGLIVNALFLVVLTSRPAREFCGG